MAKIAPPAKVECVGELLIVALVQIVIVTILVLLAFSVFVCLVVGVRVAVCMARNWGARGRARGNTFFRSGDAGQSVCVDLAQVVAHAQSAIGLVLDIIAVIELVFHRVSQGRQVACLFQTFYRGLALDCQPQVPRGESCNHNANDSGQHGEEDVVDGHKGLGVLAVAEHLAPDPRGRRGKAGPAEEAQVEEKEHKGLVVAEADAGGEPGAVVVHFQDAALARGAVVGAVGLLCLALVAEAQFTRRGLYGEGRVVQLSALLRGQMAVAVLEAQRRAGVGEDGGCVAPVEHEVEEDAESGRELS